MIEALILRRKAEKQLTHNEIAAEMAAHGAKVSPEAVGHYFTGNSGIPIHNLGAFLAALGLKVVRDDEQVMSVERAQALQLLAREASARAGDVRRSAR